MSERSRERELSGSTDMVPVEGTVDVDVPVSTLWEAFTRADLWPRWNRCMLWVHNRDLIRDRRLLGAFRPIRRWYPYVLPAVARIVDVKDKKRVTWEVTALPGFYARHTYHMKNLGGGRTRFGSWEKAMGRGFRLTRWFWVPHFVFVKDRSLEGARQLEEAYLREGRNEESTLPGRRGEDAGPPAPPCLRRDRGPSVVLPLLRSAEGRETRAERVRSVRRGRELAGRAGRRGGPAGGPQVLAGRQEVARLDLSQHRRPGEEGGQHPLPLRPHAGERPVSRSADHRPRERAGPDALVR